jgi:hypothetical protein
MGKPSKLNDTRPDCATWDKKLRQCVHPEKPHGRFPSVMTCRRICTKYEGPDRKVEPCTTCGDQPVQVVVPLTARDKIISDKADKA